MNSNCPGEGKNFHSGGPGPAKDPGAFIDGAAGGKHIVNQENSFIFDLLGLFNRKRPGNITASFRAAELGLGNGGADFDQGGGVDDPSAVGKAEAGKD